MYVALDGDTFALGGGTLTVLQAGEQPQNEGDAIDANNLSLCLRYTNRYTYSCGHRRRRG